MAEDFSIYRGASALTPNRYETERATGIKLGDPERVAGRGAQAGRGVGVGRVPGDTGSRWNVFGASDGTALHIGTTPREVDDVTGAGDVVLAILVCS